MARTRTMTKAWGEWFAWWMDFLAMSSLMMWNVSWSEADPRSPLPHTRIPPPGYASASSCRPCHRAIYEAWSKSIHGSSAVDPVFIASLREVARRGGQTAQRWCISCHSPTAASIGDYEVRRPLSREGVTCDFCHTISSVDPSHGPEAFTHASVSVKKGPHGHSADSAHRTEFAAAFTRSELCGGCHELKSRTGVPLLETYSEWKQGPYARQGHPCQECHMAKQMEMATAREGPRLTHVGLPDHSIPAGRSEGSLRNVITVALNPSVRGQDLIVEILVTNAKAGHHVPTGITNRRVVLTVGVMDSKGASLGQQQRIYQKVLVDARGEILTDVTSQLLRAARVGKDNRLAAGETRSEKFQFAFPRRSGALILTAILTYQLQGPGGAVDVEVGRAMEVVSFEAMRWRRLALMLLCTGLAAVIATGGWWLWARARPRRY